MIPIPAPRVELIPQEFWALVSAIEAEAAKSIPICVFCGGKRHPKLCVPPIPILRAFVELGRIEGRAEMEMKLGALRRELDALKLRSSNRKIVWESKRFAVQKNGGSNRLGEKIKAAERDQILKHLAAGLHYHEVSARMGISVATLYRRIRKQTA